jgi:GTP cyclohydrolase II
MSELNHHHAERGLFELRRGRALLILPASQGEVLRPGRNGAHPGIDGAGSPVLVAAVEGVGPELLARLRRLGEGELRLVVTPHRGNVLGLTGDFSTDRGPSDVNGGPPPQSTNGPRPSDVSLTLPEAIDADRILELASGRRAPEDLGTDSRDATRAESAGVALVRMGGLIPAVVCISVRPDAPGLAEELAGGSILQVETDRIEAMAATNAVDMLPVSGAVVPLEEAENARFILFREAHGLQDHVAILIGNREEWPDPVPVRLHSACLTGDLFGSLRCDCGEQLRGSLRYFAESGGGVLLYLAQEGRGIGLGNKFRAYTLQEGGLDTVDADHALGFGADERRYDVAVEMLRQLDIGRVRLLTNNPEKMRAVRDGGILVLDRQPLHGTLNRHNLPYVQAKVQRAGHWLHDMLAMKLPPEPER